MLDYDVVVVGGGPAGCMAAKYAAKEGVATLILEEDAEIGVPVQCAGLISKRALEESELRTTSFVNCELKGAIVRSQSHELLIESSEKRAFAIRRNIFDKELAKEAQKEGADLRLDSKVRDLKKREGETKLRIRTVNGTEEIRARVVIGADGAKSRVARIAGLRVVENFLHCVQIEGEYEAVDGFAEIFVGKTIAPGFFAWVIPLGSDNTARIGLCIDKRCSRQPKSLLFLKRNLSEHPILAKKYKGTRSSFTAGIIPIPVGGGLQRKAATVKIDRGTGTLLVGDAAAHVKPITGGGVYYGMKCGKLAGEIAAKACLTGDIKVLNVYERRWREAIGNEIAFGLKIHRLRCVMTDKDIETIFRTLTQERIVHQIEQKGDIDYPSIVFRALLKHPCLIRVTAKNIIKYWWCFIIS
jgi:digeranylgeranylglycerophospholipid reductase